MSRSPASDPAVIGLQKELRRVLRGLRHRRHLHPEIADLFRDAGLSPRHAAALAIVAREEGLSVGDLAAHLGVTLTAASLTSGALAGAGLVERTEDESDRRRTLLSVAEPWRPIVAEWLDERARPLHAALERLDEGERGAFVRGLAALADELEAGPAPCSKRRS